MAYLVRSVEAENERTLERKINDLVAEEDAHVVAVLSSAPVERGPEFLSFSVMVVTLLLWEEDD